MSVVKETGFSKEWQGAKPKPMAITVGVGLLLWMLPHPEGITDDAWTLLAIFVATITGIITRPLPVAAVALLGVVTARLSFVMTSQEIFAAYAKPQIWLIVIAFFLANGLIRTGLAVRISYLLLKLLGKRTIGLGYGLALGELTLAPCVPSVAARAGGVFYPICLALSRDFEAQYSDRSVSNLQGFLIVTSFQAAAVTSAMFLTAMAANPICADIAKGYGVDISWGGWLEAAIVPGLASLLFLPGFVYMLFKPEVSDASQAQAHAVSRLKEMGPMSRQEWIMLGTFLLVLGMWILEKVIHVDATTSAMLGLSILIVTGILSWANCIEEKDAWDALFWLAALVGMGNGLRDKGFFTWLSGAMSETVGGLPWVTAFLILVLVYFYSHYLFASNTAHVTSMFGAFLATALAVGVPPMLAALVLSFCSSLFGGLTHYSSGPAPIFYGARYVPLGQWWKMGLLVSFLNLTIWLLLGGAWWKFLGLW